MNLLYSRYQHLSRAFPRRVRWLALVMAPSWTCVSVLAAGLLKVAGALGVVLGLGAVKADAALSVETAGLLIASFAAEGLGFLVKERQEWLLTAAVRQLVYRRFRTLFLRRSVPEGADGHVLTYPGQIGEFALVVDSAVSSIQVLTVLAVVLTLYGAAGAVAVIIIAVLVAASIRLVTLVGRLWKRYMAWEGERRRWIQRMADALPRGYWVPSWKKAQTAAVRARRAEEELLNERVRLQVLNGFLDKGALTVTLAVVVILAAWFWPDAALSTGIVLAARYLYSAVQNNVVNYRVIRLAVPMTHELDRMEALEDRWSENDRALNAPDQSWEVVSRTSERGQRIRNSASSVGWGFVPRNPVLPQPVLAAWRRLAEPNKLARFAALARELGLSDDTVRRFWQDATTLSSGERHRAAVALVVVDQPEWLVLEDTFAALDPETRDLVARRLMERAPSATLLVSSTEYVPNTLKAGIIEHTEAGAGKAGESPVIREAEADGDDITDEPCGLSDPQPDRSTFGRCLGLLFGGQAVRVAFGALLLSLSEVVFVLTLTEGHLRRGETVGVSAACGMGAIVGSVIFFRTVYRAPIQRLSELHERVVGRLEEFARPATGGAVVGRLGEDFSDLQMSVPGAVGNVFLVLTQSLMLTACAAAGAPLFIVAVLAAMPLAWLVMRRGSTWILPATTAAINSRGDFLGVVGAQSGRQAVPTSPAVRDAVEEAYANAETEYLHGSVRIADAYALRTALIQLLVIGLNTSALLMIVLAGEVGSWVAPAAVVYFAMTLSAGVQSTVETLQEAGVVSLTAERVRMLEDVKAQRSTPPVRYDALEQLEGILNTKSSLIALVGPSGVGKSLIVDALCSRYPEGWAALVPERDPFADHVSESSGVELAHKTVNASGAHLVLLDETFKSLAPEREREQLEYLARNLRSAGKQAVVVLHSRSNLDRFDAVVEVSA